MDPDPGGPQHWVPDNTPSTNLKDCDVHVNVLRGGVEEGIRVEVWKYLLGYYQWHHTHEVTSIHLLERE
jgi:hypothetical protein